MILKYFIKFTGNGLLVNVRIAVGEGRFSLVYEYIGLIRALNIKRNSPFGFSIKYISAGFDEIRAVLTPIKQARYPAQVPLNVGYQNILSRNFMVGARATTMDNVHWKGLYEIHQCKGLVRVSEPFSYRQIPQRYNRFNNLINKVGYF